MPNSLHALLERVCDYCSLYNELPVHIEIVLQSGRVISHPVPACACMPRRVPANQEPAPRRALPPCRHSIDFRSVHWHGTDYAFSGTQAACVKVLWDAWENGTPEVSQATILVEAGSACDSLRSIFQGHPAWGDLIVLGTAKGAYRLARPGENSGPPADGSP